MIKRVLISLLFSFFILFIPKNSLASEENLIPNSSFEDGDTFPLNWNINSESFCNITPAVYQSSVEWNQSLGNIGSKSVGITNVYLPTQSTNTSIKIVSDFISIPSASQLYKLDGSNRGTLGNKGLRPEITVCFYNDLGVKLGITGTTTANPPNNQAWYGFTIGGLKISFIPPGTTKIKVGLSANCAFQILPPGSPQDCKGSVWFDDIKFQRIGNITGHKFEDKNKDSFQQAGEPNLYRYGLAFYKDFDCDQSKLTMSGWTDQNGNIALNDSPVDNYSVKENFQAFPLNPPTFVGDIRQQGWINTTPVCQNVTLDGNNPFPKVNFGLAQTPPFPYLSQTDPTWGSQEYDSANTQGPFFCGMTIAGCGCAITSSAMLLKYYGVDKDPSGNPTNPSTLNNWLKTNHGYTFGALKWNSIAAYSVKANATYQTQKIKFTGVNTANDFTALDADLNSNKPVILEEPGHFILATSKQNTTYNINDPFYQNRKTLADYSNAFSSSRHFDKTNTDLSAIYIQSPAPTDLFLTNSQGQRVGRDPATGITYTEIPNSFYFTETNLIDNSTTNPSQIPPGSGVTTLIILTPNLDDYQIQATNPTGPLRMEVSTYNQPGNISVYTLNETNGVNLPETFSFAYAPQLETTIDVTKIINIDIKPETPDNPINLKSNGVIPTAVITSPDFYATSIDINTIEFGPGKASEAHNKLHPEDIDSDGDIDGLLHFRLNDIGLSPNDTEICLSGKTLANQKVKGCDSIHIIPT